MFGKGAATKWIQGQPRYARCYRSLMPVGYSPQAIAGKLNEADQVSAQRLRASAPGYAKRLELGRRHPSISVVDALARALELGSEKHRLFRSAAGYAAPETATGQVARVVTRDCPPGSGVQLYVWSDHSRSPCR